MLRPDKEIKVAWVNGDTLAVPAQEDPKAASGAEQGNPNQIVDVEVDKPADNNVQHKTEKVSDLQPATADDTS